eukprot:351934-Chlamydomonas_euryale.AAC.8
MQASTGVASRLFAVTPSGRARVRIRAAAGHGVRRLSPLAAANLSLSRRRNTRPWETSRHRALRIGRGTRAMPASRDRSRRPLQAGRGKRGRCVAAAALLPGLERVLCQQGLGKCKVAGALAYGDLTGDEGTAPPHRGRGPRNAMPQRQQRLRLQHLVGVEVLAVAADVHHGRGLGKRGCEVGRTHAAP